MKIRRTIIIDNGLYKKAKEYASRTGRTVSGLVSISLREKLEKEGSPP
jgi:hypothetical protein